MGLIRFDLTLSSAEMEDLDMGLGGVISGGKRDHCGGQNRGLRESPQPREGPSSQTTFSASVT